MKFNVDVVARDAIFSLPGKIVWCGSMIQDPGGKCHLFFSCWDEGQGFEAWCTHSLIGYATAVSPEGPYRFVRMILPSKNGKLSWNRDVAHNPTVLCWNNRYYLYYMGNYGNGEFWNHRNHQNIGVATAATPDGEWHCSKPLLASPDAVMFSNPTVCRSLDEKFMMIYKWVAKQRSPPFYGPVRHGAAMADDPAGPFTIVNEDLFRVPGVDFPGEDPFLFTRDGRYYCLLKDNGRNFSRLSKGLILFCSTDGINWKNQGPVLSRTLRFSDESTKKIFRLERPQLSFCNNGEIRLFCAAKPSAKADNAYLLNIKISHSLFGAGSLNVIPGN